MKSKNSNKGLTYNLLAKNYNELYFKEQAKKLDTIKRYLGECTNQKILDIGCGTFFSQQWFPHADMIGLDKSKAMLKQAKGKTMQGKAEQLPFNNSTFDIILCISVIHNVDDPEQAVKEMKRVLKKEGKAVITILKGVAGEKKLVSLINKYFAIRCISKEKDSIYVCTFKKDTK